MPTNTCVNAILDGSIEMCEFENYESFNLAIPTALKGVETKLLNPINTWEDKNAYKEARCKLAAMFVENFKRYEDVSEGKEFAKAGPKC